MTDPPAHLDEHAVDVAAGAEAVWAALLDTLGATRPGAATYARLVGCADHDATGPRPLAAGSTVPGFRVAAADPPRELLLEGRHRFSTYALAFRIDDLGPGRTRLRAESRADFPGLRGRVYRGLVVGSGGHVVLVRRLLAGIGRRAERPT